MTKIDIQYDEFLQLFIDWAQEKGMISIEDFNTFTRHFTSAGETLKTIGEPVNKDTVRQVLMMAASRGL